MQIFVAWQEQREANPERHSCYNHLMAHWWDWFYRGNLSRIQSSSNHKKLRTNIWPDHGQYLGKYKKKTKQNKHGRTSIPTIPTSMSNDQRVINRIVSCFTMEKSEIFVEASSCLPHNFPSTFHQLSAVMREIFRPALVASATKHFIGRESKTTQLYIHIYSLHLLARPIPMPVGCRHHLPRASRDLCVIGSFRGGVSPWTSRSCVR